MKTRLLSLLLAIVFCVPLATFAISPHVQAKPAGPRVAKLPDGQNILLRVGENCHDIKKSDFGNKNVAGSKFTCQDFENYLKSRLGCSDLFYTHDFHTDPQDNSVVTTKWYTKQGAFKDCYNKALAKYNFISENPICQSMKKSSDNWNKCESAQNILRDVIGSSCDKLFKQSGSNNHWTVNSSRLNGCNLQLNNARNVNIIVIGADGKPTSSGIPIGDPSVEASTSSSSDNKSEVDVGCDYSINPLTWIVCPLIDGFEQLINGLDNLITSQLSVGSPGNSDNPNQIFCDSTTEKDGGSFKTCRAYHSAWSSFRNIALGMLVIASLIIIISEMSGLEFFDAYTIRKLLPRLLVAALAITLSWQLMQFLVTLTNALGYGIRFLIYQPFVHAGLDQATLSGGGATAVAFLGIAAGTALEIFGLLSFAVTGALAVLLAFLVLILRQLVIIVLIIIAPVAIAAYILPNTQNGFRIWWDSFAKALLMFPIIAAFIATGRVFAAVASQGDSTVGQIIGFAAYFAPYFMIPLTFRLAGSTMSTIGNAINQRSQGGFQALRQGRSTKAKTNMELMQTNRRFNTNRGGKIGAFNRRANSTLSNLTSPTAAAKIYGGRALNKMGVSNSIGKGILSQIGQTKLDHSQKLGNKFNELGYNDRALKALMTMPDYSAASLRNTISTLSQGDESEKLAASQLASSADFITKDLRKDGEMGRADVRAAAGLAISAQGFGDTAEIAQVANSLGGHEEGGALAAAFVTQAQLNGQRGGRLDMKPGYGIQIGEDGKYFGTGNTKINPETGKVEPMSNEEQRRMTGFQVKRLLTTGQQEFQGAKAPSVKAMSTGLRQILSVKDFDANGNASIPYTDEKGIDRSVSVSKNDVERIAAMLGTAQADYSGTSPATSAEIQKIVADSSLSGDTLNAYQRGRRDVDPSQIAGQPEPGSQNPQDK